MRNLLSGGSFNNLNKPFKYITKFSLKQNRMLHLNYKAWFSGKLTVK